MNTPRPSEADVEALAKVLLSADDSVDMRYCVHVAEQVLAYADLAARDAEHEREVRERSDLAFLVGVRFGREAAERALADLRGGIEALADRIAARAPDHYTEWAHAEVRVEREIRALLPRDDAAGGA